MKTKVYIGAKEGIRIDFPSKNDLTRITCQFDTRARFFKEKCSSLQKVRQIECIFYHCDYLPQKNVVHTVGKLIKATFQRYAPHFSTANSRNDEKCIQSVVQILVN